MTSCLTFQRRCGDKSPFQRRPDLHNNSANFRVYHGEASTIVFASRSYTFLGVECTLELGHIGVGIDGAKKDGFILKLDDQSRD